MVLPVPLESQSGRPWQIQGQEAFLGALLMSLTMLWFSSLRVYLVSVIKRVASAKTQPKQW